MVDDDARLVARVQAQDLAALGEIYDRYSGRIYTYLYHHLGDRQLAEDLTGDVFLKMLEAAKSARFARTSLSGWLFRIAHNLVYDHRRYRGPGLDDIEEHLDLTNTMPDPESSTERKLAQDNLRAALHSLTDEQQQVVLLRFAEDMPAEQVATVMGRSEGSVWSLQHRALAALRRALEGALA